MQENRTLALAKLRENPFRLVPGEKVAIWAGYEEVRRELLEIIDSPRADRVGLYEFAILYGQLGTGKSHALRYLTHLISEAQKEEFRAPVVYLSSLKLEAKTDFVSIYRVTMGALTNELRNVGAELDKAMNRIVTEEWKEWEEKESQLGQKIVKEAQFRKTRREQLEAILCPSFPPLCRLLLAITDGDSAALSILRGNKHKPTELQKFSLTNSIDNSYDAIRCLSQFVSLTTNRIATAQAPIYKAFYLFLDEVEMMRDFKPDQIVAIREGFRDLINACPEHFCFLFGFTGDAAELEVWMDVPVLTRLSRPLVEIPPLEPGQAEDFLKQVLGYYRTDDSMPAEYPFTEEALKEIVSRTTERTARSLFKNCRIVLERSVLDGELQEGGNIGVELVHKYLP